MWEILWKIRIPLPWLLFRALLLNFHFRWLFHDFPWPSWEPSTDSHFLSPLGRSHPPAPPVWDPGSTYMIHPAMDQQERARTGSLAAHGAVLSFHHINYSVDLAGGCSSKKNMKHILRDVRWVLQRTAAWRWHNVTPTSGIVSLIIYFFHPLEVLYRYRDPPLQVGENANFRYFISYILIFLSMSCIADKSNIKNYVYKLIYKNIFIEKRCHHAISPCPTMQNGMTAAHKFNVNLNEIFIFFDFERDSLT